MVAIQATSVPSISSGLSVKTPLKEMQRALTLLARIADRKSTLPILSHVAIRVSGDGTMMAATDLNVSLTMRAPWLGGWGDIAVPAKQLTDIVKNLPGTSLELERSGSGLKVASGGVDTVLIGLSGRDFPKVPSSEGKPFASVDGAMLADLIDSVLFSVCRDETRFHLNGVYLERDEDMLRAVSTDGHRLTLAQKPCAPALSLPGLILPGKGATELVKLLRSEKGAAVAMAVTDTHVFVRIASVGSCEYEIAIKRIDAQFPPYWQVIPTEHGKLVTVERKPFLAALKRAKALTSEVRGVRLDVANGKLTLTSDDPDSGTATESLTATSEWIDHGGTLKIGLNPKYLIEAISETDCKHVTLAFGGELDPALVCSTEDATTHTVKRYPYLSVIMPMRL